MQVERGILDEIRSAAGEDWTLSGRDQKFGLLRLMSRARESLYFVTGGLDPRFFESMDVLDMISHKLRRGVDVQALFSSEGVATAQEAEESLRRDNPGIASLKEEFGSKLRLFWVRRTPGLHYLVIDGTDVMNEEPDHASGFPPATITRRGDRRWAREWVEAFQQETRLADAELMSGVTHF